ncbi:CLUMA_CG020146, isoform A [Clunio marinus]|uniref:diphthine methyl ester synthase n=1 Tax=Clunio marinus TaxID=568069 RepID=A0A1J1J8C4_9DIPT|nr:CLUMA_CG020146, isoform A [Clunio marinus]
MLFVIGLGLGDVTDITVKGLELVRSCNIIYLESYTSILPCGIEEMEKFYGKAIVIADREFIEQRADEMLSQAKHLNVAFLVVGDPFGATTHTDLIMRAKDKEVNVKIVHNSSIMSAVGCCGLQLYHFGETVSIPFWSETWKPDSFYDKIKRNRQNGLHTLCLLDIKVKEPTIESLTKKTLEYLPPKFMSVTDAADQLLSIIRDKVESGEADLAFNENTLFVGLARVGHDSQKIRACSLIKMKECDLGSPLHSLVLPAENLHPIEKEYLQQFSENQL